jgi:hypothetical protein
VAELCDALWIEGDRKSKAVARDLLAATIVGAAAIPDVGVTVVVGSNADAGVRSVVDDEGVPLAASLDVGISASWWKTRTNSRRWRRRRLRRTLTDREVYEE